MDFFWKGRVTGGPDGTVVYSMDGTARSTFLRNRIGFCILHPIPECAGNPCRVEVDDGAVEPGAFPDGPSLAGTNSFGFVAKYKKNSDELQGETQFHFREGNLNFHSEGYAWLVIAGEKAIYQGTHS